MKRFIMVLAVGALMAVMLVAMAAPAFAAQYGKDNPYASLDKPSQGDKGACVDTYDGPNSPPGATAVNGNPGSDYRQTVGHGC